MIYHQGRRSHAPSHPLSLAAYDLDHFPYISTDPCLAIFIHDSGYSVKRGAHAIISSSRRYLQFVSTLIIAATQSFDYRAHLFVILHYVLWTLRAQTTESGPRSSVNSRLVLSLWIAMTSVRAG
ncbi:hypothetical protein KCU65_g307, partial [Aureobasidium melanogenum]